MVVSPAAVDMDTAAGRLAAEIGAAGGRLARLRQEQDERLASREEEARQLFERTVATARAEHAADRGRTEAKHAGQLGAAAARFDATAAALLELPDARVLEHAGGHLQVWLRPGDVQPVAKVEPVGGDVWAVDGDPAGRCFVADPVHARRAMWEAADRATAASRGRRPVSSRGA